MDIGVIGLGIIGKGLVLNIEDKGYTVSVFNRTSEKTRRFHEDHGSKNVEAFYELGPFVDSLKSPRKILMVIESGQAVDGAIKSLLPFLRPEDVIIDCGNSLFEDTERRCEEYKGRFRFLGCGVSGGEVGARYGLSVMAGGDLEAWECTKDILSRVSAESNGKSCCAYLGKGGAGHFVKMVHNGIEYSEMQILAEVYALLTRNGLDNHRISEILSSWLKNGFLKGYLAEIASSILRREDGIIDSIEDAACQKGTGMQCVFSGLENGVPITLTSDSVLARIISSKKEKRCTFSKRVKPCMKRGKIDLEDLEKAFIMAKSVAYVQGFNLISECSSRYGWDLDLKSICHVWKSGCILRGDFLNVMEKMIRETTRDLELSTPFVMIYNENYEHLKRVVIQSIDMDAHVPALSSSLFYINGLKTKRGGSCLIQAMRDCFGSHRVKLEGKEESVHIDWSE